jgi:hypothetical protein
MVVMSFRLGDLCARSLRALGHWIRLFASPSLPLALDDCDARLLYPPAPLSPVFVAQELSGALNRSLRRTEFDYPPAGFTGKSPRASFPTAPIPTTDNACCSSRLLSLAGRSHKMSDPNSYSNVQSERSRAYSWTPCDPPNVTGAAGTSSQPVSLASAIPPTGYSRPEYTSGNYFDPNVQQPSYDAQVAHDLQSRPEPLSISKNHYTPQLSQSLSVYVPTDVNTGTSKSTSVSPSTALYAPSFVSHHTSSSTTPPEQFPALPTLSRASQLPPSYTSDPFADYSHYGEASLSSRARAPRRREKPRIELANNQPLTTQGNNRQRVYLACNQW